MAAEDESRSLVKIKYDKKITFDMELHIWHGISLMLRDVGWDGTAQAVSEPLIRRPVVETLGFNTSSILAATVDQYIGLLSFSLLHKTWRWMNRAGQWWGLSLQLRRRKGSLWDGRAMGRTRRGLNKDWKSALKIELDDVNKCHIRQRQNWTRTNDPCIQKRYSNLPKQLPSANG